MQSTSASISGTRQPEYWDLLDAEGHPIGLRHVRGEPLPEGTYHRVVKIFTVNSCGELLTTLRAPDKRLFPSMWEVTGGAVVAGEDSLTAAARELREETGIAVQPDALTLLTCHRGRSYLMDMYLVRRDAAIKDLVMQPGETTAARWVTWDEFERMIGEGVVPEPVGQRFREVKPLLLSHLKG